MMKNKDLQLDHIALLETTLELSSLADAVAALKLCTEHVAVQQVGADNNDIQFIGFTPFASLTVKDQTISIKRADQIQNYPTSSHNPFNLLKTFYSEATRCVESNPLTMLTGAVVGTIGYEAIQYIEDIPVHLEAEQDLPEIALHRYRYGISYQPSSNKLCLSKYIENNKLTPGSLQEATNELEQILAKLKQDSKIKDNNAELVAINDQQSIDNNYANNIKEIKENIAKGNVYQAVPSEVYQCKTSRNSLAIFKQLMSDCPAPYHFYINNTQAEIIGASPETLVRVKNNIIENMPIAGTIPTDNKLTEQALNKFRNDKKERAEHMMLVDLARNDVGRVSQPGSVSVRSLMDAIEFGSVAHLESTVIGEKAPNKDLVDVFMANFPAGTLTGAPKISAMQLIHQLEDKRRQLYGGAFITLTRDNQLDSCIIIRTMIKRGENIEIQSGGGIVKNSVIKDEIAERKNKIKRLVQVIANQKRAA